MKKLMLLSMLLPSLAFASSSLDMSNLKCGNMQVYSNTTLKDFRDNCRIKQEFQIQHTNYLNLSSKNNDWHGQKTLYQVIFNQPGDKESIRCNFLDDSPNSTVVGCRK